MASEAIRWRSASSYYGGSHVSAMANEIKDRGLVSEYGNVSIDRVIFRHGDFPIDSLRGDGLHGTSRTVAVSESLRGRRLLR